MAAWPVRRNSLTSALILFLACAVQAAPLGKPVPFASYRAFYSMSMEPKLSHNVESESTGSMVMEWIDNCDGYSLRQRMVAGYSEDDEADTNTFIDVDGSSWEDKTGAAYQFNMSQKVNDRTASVSKGHADRKTVQFEMPQGLMAEMPHDVQFPAAFTRQVIAAARQGEHFLTGHVFEGDSDNPFPVVSVVIGVAQPADAAAELLLRQQSWKISMAYFGGEEDAVPDYILSYRLYENGVTTDMQFDYPNYRMTATLQRLTPVAAARCK